MLAWMQQRRGDRKKKKKKIVSWQLEAAILDRVKSVILVTLYQQRRIDRRVRECLCGEAPLQTEGGREKEKENTAASVAVK